MARLFSFTHLSDGKRVYLANPQTSITNRDDEGYQYFEAFEDEYLEDKIGYIGFSMSGSVFAVWNFNELGNTRERLMDIMRLALPLITLPLTSKQYLSIRNGHFPVIHLVTEGKITYNESRLTVLIPSGLSPEDFFKSTVFGGKLNDSNVRDIVLMHAYLEGVNDTFGNFRFPSIEIDKAIWPIKPEKVARAYRGMVEDGVLEAQGGVTSSGFPSFTRVPAPTRDAIETLESKLDIEEVTILEAPESGIAYIPQGSIDKLIATASKKGFNTQKLEAIVSELNIAYKLNSSQSAHFLIRALLDHISPMFGMNKFAEVADNYPWTQTDKKHIKGLNGHFRFDADDGLHTPISSRDTSLDMHAIGIVRRAVNRIVDEAADQ